MTSYTIPRLLLILTWTLSLGCGSNVPPQPPASDLAIAATRAGVEVSAWTQALSPVDKAAGEYVSFTEALQNLYFEVLAVPDLPAPSKDFGAALQLLTDGHVEQATQHFADLCTSENEGVRQWAEEIHIQLLYNQGLYREAYALFLNKDETPPPLLAAIAALPVEEYAFSEQALSSALGAGPYNIPIIDVESVGKAYPFVFDTGASFSVLTESAAAQWGVTIPEEAEVSMYTALSSPVPGKMASVEFMRVGTLEMRHHHVVVVADEALRWTLPDGSVFAIGGMLGWNAIRQVRATLDFASRRFRFEKPGGQRDERANFFWLGYPMLKIHDPGGQPLLFGYDSGSGDTSITSNISKKLDLRTWHYSEKTFAGAGGIESAKLMSAERVSLIITGHRFDISDVDEEAPGSQSSIFITKDGTLGSDLAQGCVVTVDFKSAYYEMRCSPRSASGAL